jgi:transglutaminase-like putative cysteine protease
MAILAATAGLLLGALAGPTDRTFRVEQVYTVAPASDGKKVTLFVPVPQDDPWQVVTGLTIDGARFEIVFDPVYGDGAARAELPPEGGLVHVAYTITRRERGVTFGNATGAAAPSGYARWLHDDALVKVDDRVRTIAADVTRDAHTPEQKARAIYAYVLGTMKYEKTGDGWGKGSLIWACDMKYGNCTDFHALLIGLLRASGIPARFQIGYSVPPGLPPGSKGELAGYHCWADFYLDGVGWVPVDASEAWKHPEQREYFFGHHDANRFALSTGRDISFPGMHGPALNYFVYPYAEAGGAPAADRLSRKTTFVSK